MLNIDIKATTVGAFAQIEKSEKPSAPGMPTKIVCKKMRFFAENSHGLKVVLETPVITGNGFRGALRRVMTETVLEAALKKGVTANKKNLISDVNFHLMNAGGTNNFQTQSFEVEDRVRELNPVISIFGASLAVSGKINTPSFIPYVEEDGKMIHPSFEVPTTGRLFSNIIAIDTFIKKDDLLDRANNSGYLDEEQLKLWQESLQENAKAVSATRDDGDKKVNKEGVRSLLSREYVIGGVDFYTSFSDSVELTSVEKGLLILSLEKLVTKQFGSNKARSYGIFDYEIKIDNESTFTLVVDRKTLRAEAIDRNYSDSLKKDIGAAEEWLKNISEENLQLAEIMKQKK